MVSLSCAHCGEPLSGKQRKYRVPCAPLASLLWNRDTRRQTKALQNPDEPDKQPYWKDSWKTDAERRRYGREYMREYRRGLRRRPDRKFHQCAHCARKLQAASMLSLVLITFFAAACTREVRQTSTAFPEPPVLSTTASVQPCVPEMKLWPAHHRILDATGWLGFVEANIDVLLYYPWQALATATGPAWGLAMYESGRRVVHVALQGRSDRDVVATIVHEAAHLAGFSQTGQMYDQNYAQATEAQFLETYDAIHGQEVSESNDQHQSVNGVITVGSRGDLIVEHTPGKE